MAEKNTVREQLKRIIEHSAFKNSMRCHKFLHYVVEQSLNGEVHQLKERTLGVEVFGRDASYDTSQDTVVRSTAGDIRRRLAQYYHEPGHETEIIIDLPLGSYAPEFHLPVEMGMETKAQDSEPEPDSLTRAGTVPLSSSKKRVWLASVAVMLGMLICAVIWMRWDMRPNLASLVTATGMVEPMGALMEEFWGPVIAQPAPILICIGDSEPLATVNRFPKMGGAASSPVVPVSDRAARKDVIAIARVAGFVSRQNRSYLIKTATSTTLEDMSQGSSILIGEYGLDGSADNDRVMRAMKALRFHFVGDATAPGIQIVDSKNPSRHDWSFNAATPPSEFKKDFAIIARFLDGNSGRWIIVVAGTGTNATAAAASVILDTRDMDRVLKKISGDWNSRNIEAVISVPHENGELGPIDVLAVDVW